MKNISQSWILLGGSVIVVVVIIFVFAQFTTTGTVSQQREKIYVHDVIDADTTHGPIKISDMKPNGWFWFVYSDSADIRDRDAFQKFLLIRIPVWLGGDKDDSSSFRAYSAVDLASHCLIRYWPEEGRQNIEDPCRSPAYRVFDGVSKAYPTAKSTTFPHNTGVLPMLDLSSDEDGYLYVEPPTWTSDKNGSIGIGRNVSREEILKSSEFLLQSYKKLSGISLDIPMNLENGEVLIDLNPSHDGVEIFYADPDSVTNGARMSVRFCNCTSSLDDLIAQHEHEKYKQFWQVGDTFLSVTGSALYEGEDKLPSTYTPYLFDFVKDKYKISFEINQPFEKSAKIVLDGFFDSTNLFDMKMIE